MPESIIIYSMVYEALYLACCFRYLGNLVDYLAHYLDKVQPLLDQSAMLLEMKKDFEEKWSQSQFPGWKVG